MFHKQGNSEKPIYAIEVINGEKYYSRLSFVDIDAKLYRFQDVIKTYCSPIKETRWAYYLTKVWHDSKKKIHCKTMDMLENFEIKEDAKRGPSLLLYRTKGGHSCLNPLSQ